MTWEQLESEIKHMTPQEKKQEINLSIVGNDEDVTGHEVTLEMDKQHYLKAWNGFPMPYLRNHNRKSI